MPILRVVPPITTSTPDCKTNKESNAFQCLSGPFTTAFHQQMDLMHLSSRLFEPEMLHHALHAKLETLCVSFGENRVSPTSCKHAHTFCFYDGVESSLTTKLRHLPSAPHSHHLGGADGDVPHSTAAGGSKIDKLFWEALCKQHPPTIPACIAEFMRLQHELQSMIATLAFFCLK